MRKTKIGVFGGTFDPIHNGHLFLAECLRHELKLDNVLFIPSGTSPHKGNSVKAGPKERYMMARIAVADNFWVSAQETIKKEPCYTIDTIRYLQKEYEDESDLYFLMGADNIEDMKTWKDWKQILKEIKVVAGTRPGYPKTRLKNIQYIKTPSLDISSTVIRDRIRKDLPVRYLIPSEVHAFIKAHKLYERSPNVRRKKNKLK